MDTFGSRCSRDVDFTNVSMICYRSYRVRVNITPHSWPEVDIPLPVFFVTLNSEHLSGAYHKTSRR